MTTMTMTTSYDQLEARMIDVGHARLAYRKTGSGPDLVFLHGWPLDAATFRGQLPILSPHFTCHLFDLPGAGDSEWDDPKAISMPMHAVAIERAVDRLAIDRYAMVAHDSGAAIARVVAARHAHRVTALVLGNTEIPGHEPWMLKIYVALGRVPLVNKLLALPLRSRAYRRSTLGFGGCFADKSLIEGDFFHRFVRPLLTSKRRLAGQMGLLDTFDFGDVEHLAEVHTHLRAPVLLLWGDRDPWFPLSEAKRMLPDLPPGSALEVLEGAKLFAHEEQAEDFARRALCFLQSRAAPLDDVRDKSIAGGTGRS